MENPFKGIGKKIKNFTDKFRSKPPESARAIASVADGAVVGSAIVKMVEEKRPVPEILAFVKGLADGAHSA